MSRSKHTRPHHILSADRVRAPYQPRGAGDSTTLYRMARRLKAAGVILNWSDKRVDKSPPLVPRVLVQRPSAGYYHPASRADIAGLLRYLGEEYNYGLRRVVLAQALAGVAGGRLVFGRLLVPGIILLYEQPAPPWVLHGGLARKDRERLERAGACIDVLGSRLQTIVRWPGSTLRDFMVFDVLMHEIAHHVLQQYTGKRTARIARTADHEAYADRFAAECRRRFIEEGR